MNRGWFAVGKAAPGILKTSNEFRRESESSHQFIRKENMHSRHKRRQISCLPCIKFLRITFFMCLVILLSDACTKEEQPEGKEVKAVMPIKKPMPKPSSPPLQKKPEEKKDEKQEVTPLLEEKQSEPPEDIIVEGGYYVVKKGDCLKTVAGLEEVYDDPFKWTSLFRLNMDKLVGMEITPDFQDRELPEGIDLKFVTKSEAEENLAKLGRKVYAVNVLSAETSEKIVPPAITLIKYGYNAYFCMAMVKGKKWLRLRAGFFKGYSEAVAAGEYITTILDGTQVWIARVDKNELKQFGGY